MPPSPGFSFGQNWRGERLVVERRGARPALRGGGSMKSDDGGAVPGESLVRWFIGAGSGYVFGRCNLLGTLSRMGINEDNDLRERGDRPERFGASDNSEVERRTDR
uniref:Uncharacterized protein n=1 Tax=Oryza glumipatula TaxID=40148 RepID=A0A0D9YP78_9ORYZ